MKNKKLAQEILQDWYNLVNAAEKDGYTVTLSTKCILQVAERYGIKIQKSDGETVEIKK